MRSDLLAAGVSAFAIRNDLRVGRYRRVHYGVYAIGPLSPRGGLVAALMAGGPDSALCFASALVPFGLMAHRPTIDIAVTGQRRDSEHVRFHRLSLAAQDLTVRDGLRVTSMERTLLDLAAIGADISLIAHEALAKHLTIQEKLADTADRQRGKRGAQALRRVAGEPHLRSSLERQFLPFLAANELPQPLTNQRIGPYTVDCLYPEHHLVIEIDEDAHRSAWAFEEDRARDRYLVARGYRVMRVTKQSLSPALARQLRAAVSPMRDA